MMFSQKNKKISPVPTIYLHIPFCKRICPFCDFAVCSDREQLHEKYILGMMDEIGQRVENLNTLQLEKFNEKNSEKKLLESIYIGGGTPSRLTIPHLSLLIKKVRDSFSLSDRIEMSFEMNPEDVTKGYLKDLQKIGINRISLGGQSFQNGNLNLLGRGHSKYLLRKAIKFLKKSPIKDWNLDLMFGIPNQSFSSFKSDLEEAISYDPSHISIYGLEIHKKTPFGKNQNYIEWESKNHENYRKMYLWSIERLKKSGLFQYEVSNFSKKGKEGRNNLLVWSGREYLGFGVGAHSYFGHKRWCNHRSIKNYLNDLDQKRWPIDFEENLIRKQIAAESLILGIRQCKGFNFNVWQNRFGLKLQKKQLDFVKKLCDSGFAFWEGHNFCLTPKGFLIVDSITRELMPE